MELLQPAPASISNAIVASPSDPDSPPPASQTPILMLSLSDTPDHALDEDTIVPETELPDAPNEEVAADPQKDADDTGEPTPVLDTTQRRGTKRKSSRKRSSSKNRWRISFRKSPMTLVFAQSSAEAGDTGAPMPSESPKEEAVDWRGPLLKALWPLGRSCGMENDGFPADIFAVAEKLVEKEEMSSGDIDILEVAKAKGMSFPPPRWHRPGGYDAEQGEDVDTISDTEWSAGEASEVIAFVQNW